MPSSATASVGPLTLAEQLDALLLGWLEHRAVTHEPGRPDLQAAAVVTVAGPQVPEAEAFCANWDMTVSRARSSAGRWAVLNVRGPALPVQGFSEITAMYRR